MAVADKAQLLTRLSVILRVIADYCGIRAVQTGYRVRCGKAAIDPEFLLTFSPVREESGRDRRLVLRRFGEETPNYTTG